MPSATSHVSTPAFTRSAFTGSAPEVAPEGGWTGCSGPLAAGGTTSLARRGEMSGRGPTSGWCDGTLACRGGTFSTGTERVPVRPDSITGATGPRRLASTLASAARTWFGGFLTATLLLGPTRIGLCVLTGGQNLGALAGLRRELRLGSVLLRCRVLVGGRGRKGRG